MFKLLLLLLFIYLFICLFSDEKYYPVWVFWGIFSGFSLQYDFILYLLFFSIWKRDLIHNSLRYLLIN